MKFKRTQEREVVPPVGQVIDVMWLHEHIRYGIRLVEIQTLDKMREDAEKKGAKQLLGKPTYCAMYVDGLSTILEVFPAPDEDIDIAMRFYPPAQEI